jgi:hypothetical protein
LIDVFTGLTTYSLQNHLRRGVKGLGQVETDEVYIGLDKHGAHYVLPVQAKGGKDRMSVVQIEQDFALCAQEFSLLLCRPIGAQFMADGVIRPIRVRKHRGRRSRERGAPLPTHIA